MQVRINKFHTIVLNNINTWLIKIFERKTIAYILNLAFEIAK